jgi:hypothetical protein
MDKKDCDHSDLTNVLIKDGLLEIKLLKCNSCGKTWRFNPLLNYWSDSFLGIFKKLAK